MMSLTSFHLFFFSTSSPFISNKQAPSKMKWTKFSEKKIMTCVFVSIVCLVCVCDVYFFFNFYVPTCEINVSTLCAYSWHTWNRRRRKKTLKRNETCTHTHSFIVTIAISTIKHKSPLHRTLHRSVDLVVKPNLFRYCLLLCAH